MLTSDRRHANDGTVLLTELKTDWCRGEHDRKRRAEVRTPRSLVLFGAMLLWRDQGPSQKRTSVAHAGSAPLQ